MLISGIFWGDNIRDKRFLNDFEDKVRVKIKEGFDHVSWELLDIFVGRSNERDLDRVLKTSNSILVGRVFSKQDYKAITQEEFEAISTRPDLIVEKYWGKYLFISLDKNKKELTVLRDPTGQLPFFYTVNPDKTAVFSSKMEDLLRQRNDLNWEYLANYVYRGDFSSESTPFKKILELPFGCQLRLADGNKKVSVAWNPFNYCQGYEGPEATKTKLLDTLLGVIASWTSSTEGFFLDFSGGLDSTALLFCLKNVLKKEQYLKAVNIFYPQVGSSNELVFARKIAKEVGVDLVELDCSNCLPFSSPSKSGFKPNLPSPGIMDLKVQQNIVALTEGHKNIQFVSGHGGDHLFMASPVQELLSDFYIEKGVKILHTKFKDLAMHFRTPFYPLFKKMFKGLSKYTFRLAYDHNIIPYEYKATWCQNGFDELTNEKLAHPIYELDIRGCLPGKYAHIDTIVNGLASMSDDTRDHDNPIFYPLFSQPLLELALSIPTYELFAKGYDRYPFRAAISEFFNTNSVWRKDKGDTTGLMQLGLRQRQEAITKLCMEGFFVRENLVDRDELYKNLTYVAGGALDCHNSLFHLVYLEAYLDYWRSNL